MWKYEVSNTDHTLMQGVELVNRLLLGEPETTIGMKYASTTDGRNAAVHERSIMAGSGEKKASSPDAVKVASHPGAVGRTERSIGEHGKSQPGDKNEPHVSEEELGVTQSE